MRCAMPVGLAQLTGKVAGYEDAAYRLREFIAEALPEPEATDA